MHLCMYLQYLCTYALEHTAVIPEAAQSYVIDTLYKLNLRFVKRGLKWAVGIKLVG